MKFHDNYDPPNIFFTLAYKLIYPGILGSMIFDILDPLRENPFYDGCNIFWTFFGPDRRAQICLIFIFMLDFVHLFSDLRKISDKLYKGFNFLPIFDITIALFFCISYFSLAQVRGDNPILKLSTLCIVSLTFLSLAFLCIYLYERHFTKDKTLPNVILIAPLGCSLAGIVCIMINECNPIYVTMWANISSFLFYLAYFNILKDMRVI